MLTHSKAIFNFHLLVSNLESFDSSLPQTISHIGVGGRGLSALSAPSKGH
jgi:hypothetical protein